MDNNKYKNVDFTTKTTYTELQLLYGRGIISLEEFAEKVVFFWEKMNYDYDELCEDYGKFTYCFNLFMEKVEHFSNGKYADFVNYYNILKNLKD